MAEALREWGDFLYKYVYYSVAGPKYLRPPCCPKRKKLEDWLPNFFLYEEKEEPPKPPPKQAERPPVFPAGAEVVVDGLVSEAGKALNGRCGVVRGQAPGGDRALLQLSPDDAEADWKKVKTDNLAPRGEGKCRHCQEGGGEVPLALCCECGPVHPHCAAKAFGAYLRESSARFCKAVPPQCPDCGAAYVGRVAALCLGAHLAEFREKPSRMLEEPLLRHFEAHYARGRPELLPPLAALAKWYEDQEDESKWYGVLVQRREICEQHYGTECEEFADCLFQLSIFWTKHDDMERSRPLMQRGSQIKARLREKREKASLEQTEQCAG